MNIVRIITKKWPVHIRRLHIMTSNRTAIKFCCRYVSHSTASIDTFFESKKKQLFVWNLKTGLQRSWFLLHPIKSNTIFDTKRSWRKLLGIGNSTCAGRMWMHVAKASFGGHQCASLIYLTERKRLYCPLCMKYIKLQIIPTKLRKKNKITIIQI